MHIYTFSPEATAAPHIPSRHSSISEQNTMVLLSSLAGAITCTLASLAIAADSDEYRSESSIHKLVKPYLDRDYNNRFWDYGGHVLINNDQFVRLTQDLPAQKGFLLSKLKDLPESFQVEFDFKLHGAGASMYGDGMAFWLLDQRPAPGEEIGNAFGLKEPFKGTAIFFDTYKNNRPGKSFPYVVLAKGDGSTIYDADHDGLANEIAGCSARGLHNPRDVSKARLTYVKEGFLSLELDYRGRNKWEKCFSVPHYRLDDNKYLGFSAQTGELSENHDIYSLHVYALHRQFASYEELDAVQNGNQNSGWVDPTQKQHNSRGFFSFVFSCVWFLIKIGFFVAICYGGWTFYRAYQRKKARKDPYLL